MMKTDFFLKQNTKKILVILGRKWSIDVLFSLKEESKAFSEVLDEFNSLSNKMLSERLRDLNEIGLITKEILNSFPTKIDYKITEKGEQICKILSVLDSII